jgi:hypothetical protein
VIESVDLIFKLRPGASIARLTGPSVGRSVGLQKKIDKGEREREREREREKNKKY